MIVCRKERFMICTPTKTGTEALRSFLTRRADFCKHVLPKHRVDVPALFRYFERIMVVRNPWHRLVSQYYYLSRHNAGWGKGHFETFAEFIDYHVFRQSNDPSVDWTWNLTQIAQVFNPKLIWRNESLEKDCIRYLNQRGLRDQAPDSFNRVNVSRERTASYESHYTAKLLDKIKHWTQPDAERFGYEFDDSLMPLKPVRVRTR